MLLGIEFAYIQRARSSIPRTYAVIQTTLWTFGFKVLIVSPCYGIVRYTRGCLTGMNGLQGLWDPAMGNRVVLKQRERRSCCRARSCDDTIITDLIPCAWVQMGSKDLLSESGYTHIKLVYPLFPVVLSKIRSGEA